MHTKIRWPLVSLVILILTTLACGGADSSTELQEDVSSQDLESNDSIQSSESGATSLPPNSGIYCVDILSYKASMTDAQWSNYLEELEGTQVEIWDGRVEIVDEGGLGIFAPGYTMRVVINADCDVLFTITDEAEALSFSKGQNVSVSGKIGFISDTFGFVVYLEDDPSISARVIPTKSAPSLTPIPLDYEGFYREYYGMTDLQQEQYKSSVIGTRVSWTAKVEEVSEEGRIYLSGFTEYPFIWIYLDGVPLEQAASFNKGQTITFEATVRETGTGKLGVGFALYLDNTIILSED